MQDQSKGFRGRVKEFLKSSSLTEEIVGYQTQIQGVCSKLKLMAIVETNFKVNEIHAIVTAPSFAMVKAVQNINNCPPPSRIFQGRQAILDKMHQFFATDSGNQHIYVLYGLGGAGKTQIALKFIEQSSFSNVFLVDTSKVETIDTGLKGIAVSKSVGNSAQDALMWLQSSDDKWLLFFDNSDDPKINLNDFLPRCNHGNIIITSRNPELRSYGAHTLVSDMEEADAITLLLKRANKESSEENLKLATGIVKELCYLPLAIIQAGAFISKSEDLKGYLALYHSNRARLLSEKAAQSHDDYAQTVFTTWQISFNQLSYLAATLLQLCSFLHYTGISEDMFSTASKYEPWSWSPPREELQEPLEFLSHFVQPTGEWNSLKFLDVTNEIKAYSLISFDAKVRLVSIHPLVHAWSRSTLLDETPLQSCMSSILGMCIIEIPDNERELASVQLIPHLVLLKSVNCDGVADFRRAFWEIYYHTGKFKDAQAIAEQVLEKSKFLFGDEHPHTLSAMGILATAYYKLGELQKAKELEVLVLEKRTKLLGEDHPYTLLAMGNLAGTYSTLGELQKAMELKVLVLEKHTKLLGEDHPDTLWAMENLARTYYTLEELQKAMELEVLVLEKRTKILGEDHPDTLWATENLARTYYGLEEFQKAEELEVPVLEKRRKLLAVDHPDTLRAMVNLAGTHYTLGDLNKALSLQVELLQKRRQLLGDKHPDTILAMKNLVKTYQKLGKQEEMEELEQLIEDTKRLL
ncbi:P-loop containing nucleoside triphosphate hydrolase protein [Mycena metata]|uniref:P-loop containing nucleoside triphosphate hydrolase protein n=1 Tax=Mycena metata TaxID=1033252 RepID=A0AAD7H3W8_9AGAR|nr:P-loop containing nucleoside triphosphate hydrolase protein [Mycena metata]